MAMKTSKRAIIIGVVIAAVVIPIGLYTVSPLFVSTTVNEPSPIIDRDNNNSTAQQEFKDFMAMTEEQRFEKGQQMSMEQKELIMIGAAQRNGSNVNEEMTADMITMQASIARSGVFVGVNDGIHNAEGKVKIIQPANESTSVLRLEDLKSTNGPDLYVYLSTDSSATDFVNLGRLKGNIGNQNYDIPRGTDLSRYDTVLIWCKAFSVLFGSAELKPTI